MRYACVVVHAGGDITKNVDVVEMRGRRVYLVFTVCNVPWWFARFRTFVLQRGSLPFLFRCHSIKKLAWQTKRLAKPKFFLRKNGGWSIGNSNP